MSCSPERSLALVPMINRARRNKDVGGIHDQNNILEGFRYGLVQLISLVDIHQAIK